MDGSNGPAAPFLLKTYEMVDDHFTNAIVSWSQNGHSFVVWNPPEFARVLLPNYFKHNNFSSFIRQLNTYGFRKIDPEQWEFANEEFIRGKTHLLNNIHRRKPTHSHSAQGNAVPLTDSERQEFENKIEILRQENLSLQSNLERQRLEGQGYGDGLRSLGQVLQNIDFRHGQMMTTLSQLLQNPAEYPLVIMEPLESHVKKRRLLASQILHDQGSSLHITTSLDSLSSSSLPLVNMEQVEKLDSAITSLEKLFHEIEVAVTVVEQDFTMSRLRSTNSTEMSASSGDSDFNITPTRRCVSASSSRDSLASPEMVVSSTYAESLTMSSIHINHVTSSRQKLSDTDVSMSLTKIPYTQVSKDGQWDAIDPCVQAGSNDVFWQQFLTEAPGSTKN